MLTRRGVKSYKGMHYAIIEEELFDVENEIELERAQWLMVDLDISEVQVWSSPRTRDEMDTLEGDSDVKLYKIFQPEPKNAGPKYRLTINAEKEFFVWLQNGEGEPTSFDAKFKFLATLQDFHPRAWETPDYYIEDGVLYCNGNLVIGDWVLEEV